MDAVRSFLFHRSQRNFLTSLGTVTYFCRGGWCCSPKRPDRPWGPPILPFHMYRGPSPSKKRPRHNAAHSPPSSVEARVSGATLLLPQYAFLAWTEKMLNFVNILPCNWLRLHMIT